MSYQSGLLALLALSACAQAGSGREQLHPDASGGGGGGEDAPMQEEHADAGVDSGGGGGCTQMMVNLLTNGNFDTLPAASGWTETRYQGEAIVRNDGAAGTQSPTMMAWLGGLLEATDALYQDVAVPAGATNVTLSYYYQVRTSEVGGIVYDQALVQLGTTTNTLIEDVQGLDNTSAGTSWVMFSHPFTANVAGQTVRVHLASANDDLNVTSFYFDTMALTATVCQ